jgi:hypothetical protein
MSTRREVKEANATRERVYADLVTTLGETFSGHKYLGRGTEGLVFENEDGLAIVLRVVTKAPDFDAEDAVTEYEEKEAEKVEKAKKANAKKNGPVKVVKEGKKKAE